MDHPASNSPNLWSTEPPSGLTALGIIAGSRSLPLLCAAEARRSGVKKIVAVAFENETDPALANEVDEIIWTQVGQLSKLIKAFTSNGVRHCIMAGQVAPPNLFDLRPDLRSVGVLLRLKERNAHTVFAAIGEELLKDGVELITALPWLKPSMPPTGFALGPSVTSGQLGDVQFGFSIAKEISRLEIGQSVVVKSGTVLAVEGFEGTDRCLQRGGELAGKKGGAIAVKVSKPNHDLRFDLPCVGERTLQVCAQAGIHLLAFEADRTILLDRPALDQICREAKISLISVPRSADSP